MIVENLGMKHNVFSVHVSYIISYRCQDYVNVTNRGSYNEFCGSATFREPLVLTDKIVVSFRTSEEEPIREGI